MNLYPHKRACVRGQIKFLHSVKTKSRTDFYKALVNLLYSIYLGESPSSMLAILVKLRNYTIIVGI